MVTGMRFQYMNCPHVTFAPAKIPAGIKYMLATLCSKPESTKAMMGNHISKNLPAMSFDAIARRIATFTKRLHAIPFIKADHNPIPPAAIYGNVFASAMAIAF